MTLGEIAYRAFAQSLNVKMPEWSDLDPAYQTAWEDVAEAVKLAL